MKRKKRKQLKYLIGLVIAAILILYKGYDFKIADVDNSENSIKPSVQLEQAKTFSIEQKPLVFSKEMQFVMSDLDSLGRATDSHIQMRAADLPTEEREGRINYDPTGWHNYKLKYGDEGKKAWLFDRGHLIGYQFCGINDEPKNLVQMTSQLNKGNLAHMDSGNEAAMLFYEGKLAKWLVDHPEYTLDYQVTALYTDNELTPRQLRLAYLGYDSTGKEIPIILGTIQETEGNHATVVVLDNVSDNAEIDYLTGQAKAKE